MTVKRPAEALRGLDMRLVCPNCSAQYEVPDNVIPEGGRDVQCSNCGHTWFQRHPDDDPGLAEDLNEPQEAERWDPDVPEEDEDWEDEAEDIVVAPPPPKRELDPKVAGILREEAEREKRARTGADPLESQPELGLENAPTEDEEARRAREARERMARMRGEDPDGPSDATASGSRRELLPDIDEINSKLRASSDRQADADDTPAEPEPDYQEIARKGGFSRGFLFAIIVAAFLIAGYVFAPQISAAVPAAQPTVDLYVGIVDGLRASLNQAVANVLTKLGSLGGEAG